MGSANLHIVNAGEKPFGVCSLLVLTGFGEKQAGGYSRAASYADYGPCAVDYKDFLVKLKEAFDRLDKMYPVYGHAMITAWVTSKQPIAQGWLRQAGFTEFRVDDFPKYAHGLSQFTITIPDFYKLLGLEFKEDDRYAGHFVASSFVDIVDAELEAARAANNPLVVDTDRVFQTMFNEDAIDDPEEDEDW